ASAPNSLYPAGLQPEMLSLELIRAESDAFDAAHAAGITTALVVPRDGIFLGQSALVDLAGESAQEMVLRSPIALHVGFTPLRNGGYPNSLMGVFSSLRDRKSTRLNSSHVSISYAVFCLKKKKI